ncbi:MAG: excisionase family DNA-binding protein [Acidobacteriota bacterium]|jgi:excisionase family DNA binding protein
MRLLTTRELAHAIGVSESSIKRWADDGVIRASRTAGGHRRIPLPEALRFVREHRAVVLHPQILGLEQPAAATLPPDPEDYLFRALRDGEEESVHELLSTMVQGGATVAEVIDGPLRTAMTRIGELWRHDPEGLLIEHRATDIVVRALNDVRMSLPQTASGPVAVGGAPSGDPYAVPSLAVATALAAEGWRPVNFGPDTPLESLARAANWLSPRLIWISCTVGPLSRSRLEQVVDLARTVAAAGVEVVVGGQAVGADTFPRLANVRVFSSLGDMVAWARSLTPRRSAASPRPGRRRGRPSSPAP